MANTGGSVSLTVDSTTKCDWNAVSEDGWLSVTVSKVAAGTGTATITVSPNTGAAPRRGHLEIAGRGVMVEQAGSTACSYKLSSMNLLASKNGGDDFVSVTTDAQCTWSAASSASWLHVSGNSGGSGKGRIDFKIDDNPSKSDRSATLEIGDQVFTVNQPSSLPNASSGLRFHPVTPCRVVDTRKEHSEFGGPYIAGQTTREFVIPNSSCNIPATASAYALNVTAVPNGGLGYLTVWSSGQPRPLTSTLNSQDGRIRANASIMMAGDNGAVSVFASNDTHLVMDVAGYFSDDSSDLMFFPLAPCRILDTRKSDDRLGFPFLHGGEKRTFDVASSSCKIPSGAQAYSLNMTAVPHSALGYLTVWPTGQSQPTVSTLNAPTGTVTANAAVVPAGTSGSIDVFASNDSDLVIDINGYFGPAADGGLSLHHLGACRTLDTREVEVETESHDASEKNSSSSSSSSNGVKGKKDISVTATTCGVPEAEAYVMNATVVPSEGLGYLTLWPTGQTQPLASTLNATDASVTANMAIVPASKGSVSAFTSNNSHLVLDVFGYFAK